MEFASIFAALGTEVSVVERLPNILTGVEPELIRRALPLYRKAGLSITVDASVEEVTWGDDDDLAVHYSTASGASNRSRRTPCSSPSGACRSPRASGRPTCRWR